MAKFQIFSDSCCDLPKAIRDQYHLDYCRMNFVVDGKEYVADLDWTEVKPEEFYGFLSSGRQCKTTQVPLQEFINRFTPYLQKGIDVLYIACSSRCSGSINVFELAKQELQEKFPERKLIGIDALNCSFGEGTLAILASKKQDEGASLEEVADYVTSIRNYIMQFATVDDLKYIKNAGRIKASKAIMGTLFHKKPVFISDAHGDNYTLGTVTGTKNADLELFKGTVARLQKDKFKTVFIGQGMAKERAERLKLKIEEAFPDIEVRVCWIGPIIGTTCGPGVLAVFGYGKEVTCSGDDKAKIGLDYSRL